MAMLARPALVLTCILLSSASSSLETSASLKEEGDWLILIQHYKEPVIHAWPPRLKSVHRSSDSAAGSTEAVLEPTGHSGSSASSTQVVLEPHHRQAVALESSRQRAPEKAMLLGAADETHVMTTTQLFGISISTILIILGAIILGLLGVFAYKGGTLEQFKKDPTGALLSGANEASQAVSDSTKSLQEQRGHPQQSFIQKEAEQVRSAFVGPDGSPRVPGCMKCC